MSDATFQFVCHFDSQSSEQSDMCVQITQENELYNNETASFFLEILLYMLSIIWNHLSFSGS